MCPRPPRGCVCMWGGGVGWGGARDCRRAQAKGLSTRTWVLLPGSLLLQMGLWSGGHRPPSWQQESAGLVGSPCWSGEREPGHFCGARRLRVHGASPPDPGRQLRVAPVAMVSGPRLPQMQTQREEVSAKAPQLVTAKQGPRKPDPQPVLLTDAASAVLTLSCSSWGISCPHPPVQL